MLETNQRHRHSGLSGDGEKIKFKDLEGIPTLGGLSKVGHFIITSTGSKSITGIGFKPKNLRILSCISGGTGPIKSDGVTDGVNMYTVYDYNTNTGMKMYYVNDRVVMVEDGSTGTFYDCTALITSFDTDGFTLDVTNKTLAGTVDCVYIAF